MNRLDQRHRAARVALNRSFQDDEALDAPVRRRMMLPVTKFYAAILGFVCCGAVVVISAGMLALQIQ